MRTFSHFRHPGCELYLRFMAYRKISSDRIFDGYRFVDEQVLVVNDSGMVEGLVPVSEAGDGVEYFEGILTPGLVNCHCHLELSHMKGHIPENTGLVDFVYKVVTERNHPEEEILHAIEKAENEMLHNGIVAVGDICNNRFTISQKQKNRLRYYNFIEASGWLPSLSSNRFERAKKLWDEFSAMDHPCSIVPHAPYSVSENLWDEIKPYYKNKTVTIHNQETRHEDEFFLEAKGDFLRMYQLMKIDTTHHVATKKTSLQSYFHQMLDAENLVLVHNTFSKKEDIDFIQLQTNNSQLQTFFCLCVRANQYIENVFPPVGLLRENRCTIVLGTDSLASNWSLDISGEIRTIKKQMPFVPLEEILQWATINGARALKLENELGSFEKRKKPGVVCINEKLEARRIL